MFKKAVLIGFILGLAPALAASASALTLQEALAQTRENLPSYQAAKKKVESADALYGATLGPYLPSLDASAFRDRHDADRVDYYSSSGYDITLSYRLFDGKRRASRDIAGFNLETEREELRKNLFELGKFYRTKSARIEISISEENIREFKRQLLLDCRKGWEDLVTAVRNEAVAAEQLRRAEQNYEQAFGEYKAGKGDILSLVQAESLLAIAREQLTTARMNAVLARALLEKIAGREL